MGFSIESPGFKDFERRLAKLDLRRVAHQAAEAVALDRIVGDLEAAARAAGASRELRDDIGFYYQDDGDVVVGIPGGPSGQEAFDLEYGTAVGAPAGWLRATFAQNQRDYNDEFGAHLTRALAKGWSK